MKVVVNNDFNVPDVLSKGQIISVLLQMDNYVPATLTIHEEVEVTRKFKIPELMTLTLYYSLCDRATINEKILRPSKSNPTKAVDTMFKDKKQGPPVAFENTMIVLLPNPLICHPSNVSQFPGPLPQLPATLTFTALYL